MHIDRRAFLATLVRRPSSSDVLRGARRRPRALHAGQLDKAPAAKPATFARTGRCSASEPSGVRVPVVALSPMPERPTLVDFLRLRGTPGIGNHILQSAGDA